MSAEIIAIVISAVGVVVTLGAALFAGFAWIVRRMDAMELRLCDRMDAGDEKLGARIDAVDDKLTARIDAVEDKLTARIDAVDDKLTARIDAVEDKLGARIDALAGEVTGVKIAIARLEGPPRHLVSAHH